MILGQISYLDCVAFLLFLIPQLLVNVNIFELIFVTVKCIPFLSEWSGPATCTKRCDSKLMATQSLYYPIISSMKDT